MLDLRGVALDEGRHRAKLVAASAGRAVVDCIQLQPARRESGAIGAEDVTIVRATGGGEAPRPGAPRGEASGGRFLEWSATGVGQGAVVEIIPRPKLPHVLGVRAWCGPDCGTLQAFAGDRPLGPAFSLYADKERPSEGVLPLGPIPEGEVELRVVGKTVESRGYRVALDYFRYEPAILGPGSAEGVWARVLRTAGFGHEFNPGPPSSANVEVGLSLQETPLRPGRKGRRRRRPRAGAANQAGQ